VYGLDGSWLHNVCEPGGLAKAWAVSKEPRGVCPSG